MNKKQKSSLATAGMVLGIIAIVLSFIPIVNNVAFVLGALAVIFGVATLVKKKSIGKAVAALILGILSIVITIMMQKSLSDAIDNATTKTSTTNDTKTTSDEKKKLTLDDGWALDTSNPYSTKVTGTVSNNSDKAVDGYIQITFAALDASGANVGDCLANANTVDANGKWKFEAICSGNDIASVRFKELSGF